MNEIAEGKRPLHVLLIVYGIVNAAAYCCLLPLWEGFDEACHYGYDRRVKRPVASHKPFADDMVFWRIRDGQIVERWGNLDRLCLQRQLSAES